MKPISIRLRPARATREARGGRSASKPVVTTIGAADGAGPHRVSRDNMHRQVELAASRGLPQGARARLVMRDRFINGAAPDQDGAVTLRRGATD